jgi:hypothetical protein
MKQFQMRFIACSAALSAAVSACGSRQVQVESPGDVALPTSNRAVDAVIAAWPMKPREAASKLTAKYGQPDVASDRVLIWYDKSVYKKIALSRDEQAHNFPMPHTDFLSQTVMYRVLADKVNDVVAYDGSVWFHRTRGELTAQCDIEEMNNLALNLAVDVATGTRTVADARAFYAKTAMAFKGGDTSSPYVVGLRFQPTRDAADTDKPHQM